jgi:hypothetical protein
VRLELLERAEARQPQLTAMVLEKKARLARRQPFAQWLSKITQSLSKPESRTASMV